MANSAIGEHRGGIIPAVGTQRPVSQQAEPAVLVAPVDDDNPPRPPPRRQDGASSSMPAASTEDDERKERLAALRRALAAPTAVEIKRERESATNDNTTQELLAGLQKARANDLPVMDPAAAYRRALELAQGADAQQTHGAAKDGSSSRAKSPTEQAGAETKDRFRLDSALERPRSQFVVQAGAVIPATLISAVNSELPGPIIAQTAQAVYDSPTGAHLLIPQGAKLFGEYSSDVAFGQSRLLIAWQRITMPNGSTIDIGSMPGTDGVGRVGFEDQVDNHYFRLFASALLLSGVTAGVALSQESGSNPDRVTAGSAMSQAVGQQLGQVSAQLIQKNMNIAPTVEIRPGYRFNIVATKDVVFPAPYRRRP
jgi:type IV secretion system protein VirB10